MQMSEAVLRVVNFASQHQLFDAKEKLLLAVSGGRDSMCMLSIFEQTEQPFGVAHMNFQLRGEESDRDADFVTAYCAKHRIQYHIKKVDCRAYMAEHGVGLQVEARDLRYAWMSSLIDEYKYQVIATAHHQDDSVETVMINLMRGTGIRGLSGIPIKREGIIRPLMCFDSPEIQSIVDKSRIAYSLDSSNNKDDYLRNRIRHHLIPLMNEINPGSSKNMMSNIRRMRGQLELLEAISEPVFTSLSSAFNESGGNLELNQIKSFPSSDFLLFHLATRYGFTHQQCESIIQSTREVGVRVLSSTHEMILDRGMIRIELSNKENSGIVDIHIDAGAECGTGFLQILPLERPEGFNPDPNIEFIAADRISNCLTVRTWITGDRFIPLGMQGSQKVSDLLTNLKYSTFQKRKVKVLLDGDKIVWVIGVRLSEEFKVGSSQKDVVKLIWTPHRDQ